MFAGQNSFEPGMGEEAYMTDEAARRSFYTASEVFGVDMAEICFGSLTEKLPKYAQQAVVTAQVAEFHRLRSLGLKPDLLMPHSIGEFACLAISKVASERDTFRLTQERAEATAEANKNRPGWMAALLGFDDEQVALLLHRVNRKMVALKKPTLAYLANRNWNLEKVVSGHQDAIDRLERIVDMMKSLKIVRKAKVVWLKKIPGAFHSPHNDEAVAPLEEAFRRVKLSQPEITILGNQAVYLEDPETFPSYFANQLRNGVDFQSMMHVARKDGVNLFREVGGQGTLEGFVKKEFPRHEVVKKPYGEVVVVKAGL